MSLLQRLARIVRRRPPTDEELAERAESQRMRDDMETQRLSQRSGSGQNYQSGRGQRQ